MGRTASAWALFLDVAAAARAANQTDREQAARQRATDLKPRLTRLRVSVSDPTAGMSVTRDGQPIGDAGWGTPVPVDPGDHQIVAEAPGKLPWSQDVKVPAAAKTFSIDVPPLRDAPVEAMGNDDDRDKAVGAPMSIRDEGGANGQQVAAIVIGGVGVAALTAGTVFALQFRSDNDKALGMCRTPDPDTGVGRCADDIELAAWQETVKSAEKNQLLGYVGFGVGAGALITAAILYATADSDSPHSGPPQSARMSVTPLLGDGLVGAGVVGTF
jgi:hypothetical protein